LSGRELGGGWKGLVKAIGWSVAFGVEGLVIGLPAAAGLGLLIRGEAGAEWFTTPGLWQALTQGAGLVLGFGIATLHIGRRVLGRSWEELRWRGPRPPGAWFARGLALGGIAAALAMVLGLVAAGARWSTGEGTWLGWTWSALWTTGALALPALSEEIIFRGVPLVLLAGVLGRWPAVLLTSVTFGLVHWSNPGITALGMANIGLAGVLLGVAFFAPGGIWTAWGAHLGWNVSLAVLGAPVSGLPLAIPLVEYDAGGPTWLSGGAFGPEGGVLGSLAMVAGIAVLSRWIEKGTGKA
jgi:membrane protease YdiL (CAAX protease family)